MMDPDIRYVVSSAVKRHLGEDVNKPGAVLYNGWDTLRSNNGLYIMGFNPGGDPNKIKTSVLESLEIRDNYCSYWDECWRESCQEDCKEHHGMSRHQERVRSLAQVLGCDIRETPAANAIFLRSKSQNDLDSSWELFKKCWPVHEVFLSIVQPRIILCLGNGESASAFSFLRKMLASNEKTTTGLVKSFSVDSINCLVIGVRHPSYPWFDPTKDLSYYLHKNSVLFREGVGRHKDIAKEGLII